MSFFHGRNINRRQDEKGGLLNPSSSSFCSSLSIRFLLVLRVSEFPRRFSAGAAVTEPAWVGLVCCHGDNEVLGGGASVRGHGDDADVQEAVGVAEVFAEPLQRRLQQRLDAMDHHLEALRPALIW